MGKNIPVFATFCTNKRMDVPGFPVPGFPGSRGFPGSGTSSSWNHTVYLNYVLFVVIVLCYSVMNMKYFRYIGIIDEYVKNRAEKFDSATIMKMK